MSRLLPLLAALLVLSACDSGAPDPARLAESAIRVDLPDFVVLDGQVNIGVTFTNDTGRALYLARPSAELWTGDASRQAPFLGYIISGVQQPARVIAVGETVELDLPIDLDENGPFNGWDRFMPLDGRYRVALPLATSPGDDDSWRGDYTAEDMTFSAPFDLTFRWPNGHVFGG